jgi:hypothetical protein
MNSHLFGAAIWELSVPLFWGGGGGLSAVYSHVGLQSCCGLQFMLCVVHFDFRVLRKKYAPFS